MCGEEFKYRILVVEDGLLNQRIIQTILGEAYTLAQALTAGEAFEKVTQFQPHLILLDIILPDANGFDVLTSLKSMEESRGIPVIIITGLVNDEDEERGFMLGAVDYIRKPFKNSIVRARVNTQIHIIKQLQTIEQLGLMDALTGISNRRAFDNQIRYEWERAIREQREISMTMLDIDKFKRYNDTYGHPQGDIMLQCVAKALSTELNRSMSQLYRYGGEEFSVLLPGTDLAGAIVAAEHMRKSVEKAEVFCFNTNSTTRATVSIGVATARPKATDSLCDFIERADHMLYKAKNSGRNRVQFE